MADRFLVTRPRTALAASVVALVSMLALAVSAYACSGVMGNLVLNPSSGPPGTVVTTTATGLKPFPAKYDLFFGGACMTFTGKLLKTIQTNAQGGWTNVKVTVPKRAKMGSQALCGVESYPSPGSTATTHDSFTVV